MTDQEYLDLMRVHNETLVLNVYQVEDENGRRYLMRTVNFESLHGAMVYSFYKDGFAPAKPIKQH